DQSGRVPRNSAFPSHTDIATRQLGIVDSCRLREATDTDRERSRILIRVQWGQPVGSTLGAGPAPNRAAGNRLRWCRWGAPCTRFRCLSFLADQRCSAAESWRRRSRSLSPRRPPRESNLRCCNESWSQEQTKAGSSSIGQSTPPPRGSPV